MSVNKPGIGSHGWGDTLNASLDGLDARITANEGGIVNLLGFDGGVHPEDHGLLAWSADPSVLGSSQLAVNGTIYLVKMHIRRSVTVNNIVWWVNVAGVTPTAGQNKVGLYSSSGTLLTSAVVDSDITSAGVKTTAITPQPLSTGFVWVAVLFNAGTAPTIVRGSQLTGGGINAGLTAATFRFANAGTAQTTLPGSITPSSNTASAFAGPWAAIS